MQIKTLDGGPVNVRSTNAAIQGNLVGSVPNGTTVEVKGSAGQWFYIIAPNAVQGYVVNQFLICP